MFDNQNSYKTFCRYYAAFFDGSGTHQEVEINAEIFAALEDARKADKKVQNFKDRHEDQRERTEDETTVQKIATSKSLEDMVCEREQTEKLQAAIDALPEIQRRRFLLYHKYDLTYEQIAEVEGCTKMPVKRSIDRAKELMQKYFLDFSK